MLAVVGLSSGVLAQPPYVVEDVYQGNPNGTGFFDMFTFFTVGFCSACWNQQDL